MASDAAKCFEQVIAFFLFGRDCLALAPKIAIEARVRGDERPLIRYQCVEHLLRVDWPAIGFVERGAVLRIRAQLASQLDPVCVHQPRAQYNKLVLLRDVTKPARPVKAEVERGIEYCRRVAIEHPASLRRLAEIVIIGPSVVQLMTGDALDGVPV